MASIDDVHEYIRERKAHLLAQALVEDPSITSKADSDGRTPVMWALSESQNSEIVSEVLKAAKSPKSKFDVDAADNAGFTALHIAASLGADFVELILPFDPMIDAETANRQTPLFLAVSKNKIDAAKLLLDHGARPGAKDKRQQTSLQRAAATGSTDLVKLLIARKAPVNATDADGWTALHHAYAEGRNDVITLLLENGANPELKTRDDELPQDVAPNGFTTIPNVYEGDALALGTVEHNNNIKTNTNTNIQSFSHQ